jgi:hypothetical protein
LYPQENHRVEVNSKTLSQERGDRRVRDERYTRDPLTQDQGF